MRLLLIGLFLLLGGCSFMADAGEKDGIQTVKANDYEDYDANIETKIEMFDDLSIVMHYPETPNDQVDQTVLDYLNGKRSVFKKESYQRVQKNGISALQELHVDYEIVYEDPDTYVIKFKETETWGKNRKETDETYLHFNKSNGKRLTLSHFLKEKKARETSENVGEAISDERFGDFLYKGDSLTLFPGEEEETRIDKSEHPDWFKEKFRKQFVMRGGATDSSEQLKTDLPETKPVTEQTVSDFPVIVMGGPHPERTEQLLQILEKHDQQAMFYLSGNRAERYPEQVKAIKERGHEIVSHTWNHRIPERMSVQEQENHQKRSVRTLASITDQEEIFVDTGKISPEQALINRANWKDEPFEWVVDQVRQDAKARGYLVVSDLNDKSPKVLEELLPRIEE
ncbi:polysaccharide deacetylase family protein [Salimicrobium halophilum]|uniref:Polysaccharide deacetylase n=1 Tax=Salimicrobium halophilum TaxID=86666 RepID=A0A1G8SUW3_9BACI|nr:polysaccharide deacetylase family protein [Salimicrobium halophilum]SDJ32953.1 Polysaccharide deacetylase [Salimicrobium halophilum]